MERERGKDRSESGFLSRLANVRIKSSSSNSSTDKYQAQTSRLVSNNHDHSAQLGSRTARPTKPRTNSRRPRQYSTSTQIERSNHLSGNSSHGHSDEHVEQSNIHDSNQPYYLQAPYDNANFVYDMQPFDTENRSRYMSDAYDLQEDYVSPTFHTPYTSYTSEEQPQSSITRSPTPSYDDLIDVSEYLNDEEDPLQGMQYLNTGHDDHYEGYQGSNDFTHGHITGTGFPAYSSPYHQYQYGYAASDSLQEQTYPGMQSQQYPSPQGHHNVIQQSDYGQGSYVQPETDFRQGNFEPGSSTSRPEEEEYIDIGIPWNDENELVYKRLHPDKRKIIVDYVHAKRGYQKKNIRERLVSKLTPPLAQDILSKRAQRMKRGVQAIFPIDTNHQAAQSWANLLNEEDEKVVIEKLAMATDQAMEEVRNVLLHRKLSPTMAQSLLTASLKECKAVAQKYDLFKRDVKDLAWKQGLTKEECGQVLRRMMDTGLEQSTCYKYLKRAKEPGIGRRVLGAGKRELDMLIMYMRGKGPFLASSRYDEDRP
ncbi:hypothetical protein CBS101457_000107 [Exobasidium rhododendri]|nr:hypothetical protein CBS101457_000107 [Exobasidium rhododendri]